MRQELPSNYGPKRSLQLVISATGYHLEASTENRPMKHGPARNLLSDIFTSLDVQLIATSTRRRVARSSTRSQCWAILSDMIQRGFITFITPAPRKSRCHEMSYSQKTNLSVYDGSTIAIRISFPPRTMSMIQVPNPVTTSNKTRSQMIPSYTMNLRSKHLLQLQLHRMTTGRGQQQANFQIDENGEPLHELSRLFSRAT